MAARTAQLSSPIEEPHPHVPSAIAALADEATAEISRFDAEIGSELARRGSAAWRLADLLRRQPIIDAAEVAP